MELTASFLPRLETIEAFLTVAEAAPTCHILLNDLRTTVVPNLQRFPHIGRRYLDTLPQSAEAM